MEDIEYIDNYFCNLNTDAEKNVFEQKIIADTHFANAVAFYISANDLLTQQAHQQKKLRFKEIYQQQNIIPSKVITLNNTWRYIAAACVIIVMVILSIAYFNKPSPQQLAHKYIEQNFTTLGVTMGTKLDSLQKGLVLYNDGNYIAAQKQFELILKNDPSNIISKKYAGIVSLQLKNYDKALVYFSSLEAEVNLFSNPGKFYKALTLLERNKEGDKEIAKTLLQQVVTKNLDGKNIAISWLNKL